MRSFIVKMRVTEIRELVEAKDADQAASNAERGVFVHDYAHCHAVDWEVCEVKAVARARVRRRK
jgi:hypothetical protein